LKDELRFGLVSESKFSLIPAFANWWRQQRKQTGTLAAFHHLLVVVHEFLRDSLPDRRRQRYGDIDFDWEHRVDTTGATVSRRTRLLGLLSSPYQPIPPEQFREMMSALLDHLGPASDFSQFTFIDIGSGKGRALLLASEYEFRRIIGIELLPELHRIARENVRTLQRRSTQSEIELLCGDATTFSFPVEPTVVFLFNPLPEATLRTLLQNLESSLRQHPRRVYVAYANPIFERTISRSPLLTRLGGNHQYLLFGSSGG
jgi:SAM-dependent methyltransferase